MTTDDDPRSALMAAFRAQRAIERRRRRRVFGIVLFIAGLALMFGLIISAMHAGVWE